jgi:hypothetical protein
MPPMTELDERRVRSDGGRLSGAAGRVVVEGSEAGVVGKGWERDGTVHPQGSRWCPCF